MWRLIRNIVGSFFVLLFSVVFIDVWLVSLVKAESVPLALDRQEQFLLSLYNGLTENGFLEGKTLETSAEFWIEVDADQMRAAIEAFTKKYGGAYVTPYGMFGAETPINVTANQDGKLIAKISGLNKELWIGKRSGLINCQEKPVSTTLPYSGINLAFNLQCRYATYVRNAFLAAGGGNDFSFDFIVGSGVENELRMMLSQAMSQGIIESYSLDVSKGRAGFALKPSKTKGKYPLVLLDPLLVNIYADADAESAAVVTKLMEDVKDSLVYIDGTGLYDANPVSAITEALATVSSQETDYSIQKRRALLTALGYGWFFGSEVIATPTPTAGSMSASSLSLAMAAKEATQVVATPTPFLDSLDPCKQPYSAGVVTPCNRKVAVFQSYDYNGNAFAHGAYNHVQDVLNRFKYSVENIPGRLLQLPNSAIAEQMKLLRKAQTIIMNAHGYYDGGVQLQAYGVPAYEAYAQGVPMGPSAECCGFMKATAIALELPNADKINCTQRPRDNVDKSTSIALIANSAEPIGQVPSCSIVGYPGLFSRLGTKAALISAQCFGARVPSMVPVLSTAVMDYFGQAADVNYEAVEIVDDRLIADDIGGQRLYCKSTAPNAAAPLNHEPWSGRAGSGPCSATTSMFPKPGEINSIQFSLEKRHSIGENALVNNPIEEYNADGWKMFSAASKGGDNTVAVEFAPIVSSASFDAQSRSFAATFSSKMRKLGSYIRMDPGQCKRRKNADPIYAPGGERKVTEEYATFQLGEGYRIMSPKTWAETDPAVLKARYQHDQSDWPWYIKVTIGGAAPNGIEMIGNQGATKKWIWSDNFVSKDPPWLFTNGELGPGGNTTEIRIPCDPPSVCCMPNVEVRNCLDGDKIKTYCHENGCSLVEGVYEPDCWTSATDVADLNCKARYNGTVHSPWYEGCKGINSDTKCDLIHYEPEGVAADALNCFMTPGLSMSYQYRAWPVDGWGKVQRCPAIGCPPLMVTPFAIPKCGDVIGTPAPTPPAIIVPYATPTPITVAD